MNPVQQKAFPGRSPNEAVQFSFAGASGSGGSGGCGDDEESADGQEDEDEDGDGDRPTLSLGIVAGERIPCELFLANIPQRQVARESDKSLRKESATSDNEEKDKYSIYNDSFRDENNKGDSGNEHVLETPLHNTQVNRDQGQKNDNSVHVEEQVNSKEDSLESSCPSGFESFKTQKQNTPQRLVTSLIIWLEEDPGGFVSIWDPLMFTKTNIWCDDHFIIVQGKWFHSDDTFFMINVYGTQDPHVKIILWDKLKTFIRNNHIKSVLFGDLNEVRDDFERIGSYFLRAEVHDFNTFINETGLVDLPMRGRRFSWMNKAGSKLSKLDCFLVSQSVTEDNVNLKAIVLERGWSDHNPILLHDRKMTMDPSLSIYFIPGFYERVFMRRYLNPLIRDLHLKMQQEREPKISDMDLAQKSRIKRDIEGAKNLKFFHGLINQRRRQQMIPSGCNSSCMKLNGNDRVPLDKEASLDEVKNAIWDCGSSKAPGPDGFSFMFLKKY
nr:RNA-directed DNA polymerase, eukaryota, reverse transcriptase zinc-binding domain protein [Tanacetum cinerariifolium]